MRKYTVKDLIFSCSDWAMNDEKPTKKEKNQVLGYVSGIVEAIKAMGYKDYMRKAYQYVNSGYAHGVRETVWYQEVFMAMEDAIGRTY